MGNQQAASKKSASPTESSKEAPVQSEEHAESPPVWYEEVKELDIAERWKERNAVVTSLDHKENRKFVLEILDDVIKEATSNGNEQKTPSATCKSKESCSTKEPNLQGYKSDQISTFTQPEAAADDSQLKVLAKGHALSAASSVSVFSEGFDFAICSSSSSSNKDSTSDMFSPTTYSLKQSAPAQADSSFVSTKISSNGSSEDSYYSVRNFDDFSTKNSKSKDDASFRFGDASQLQDMTFATCREETSVMIDDSVFDTSGPCLINMTAVRGAGDSLSNDQSSLLIFDNDKATGEDSLSLSKDTKEISNCISLNSASQDDLKPVNKKVETSGDNCLEVIENIDDDHDIHLNTNKEQPLQIKTKSSVNSLSTFCQNVISEHKIDQGLYSTMNNEPLVKMGKNVPALPVDNVLSKENLSFLSGNKNTSLNVTSESEKTLLSFSPFCHPSSAAAVTAKGSLNAGDSLEISHEGKANNNSIALLTFSPSPCPPSNPSSVSEVVVKCSLKENLDVANSFEKQELEIINDARFRDTIEHTLVSISPFQCIPSINMISETECDTKENMNVSGFFEISEPENNIYNTSLSSDTHKEDNVLFSASSQLYDNNKNIASLDQQLSLNEQNLNESIGEKTCNSPFVKETIDNGNVGDFSTFHKDENYLKDELNENSFVAVPKDINNSTSNASFVSSEINEVIETSLLTEENYTDVELKDANHDLDIAKLNKSHSENGTKSSKLDNVNLPSSAHEQCRETSPQSSECNIFETGMIHSSASFESSASDRVNLNTSLDEFLKISKGRNSFPNFEECGLFDSGSIKSDLHDKNVSEVTLDSVEQVEPAKSVEEENESINELSLHSVSFNSDIDFKNSVQCSSVVSSNKEIDNFSYEQFRERPYQLEDFQIETHVNDIALGDKKLPNFTTAGYESPVESKTADCRSLDEAEVHRYPDLEVVPDLNELDISDEYGATCADFKDPSAFDFFEKAGNSKTCQESNLKRFSLYCKFDPLVRDSPVQKRSKRMSVPKFKEPSFEEIEENSLADDDLLFQEELPLQLDDSDHLLDTSVPSDKEAVTFTEEEYYRALKLQELMYEEKLINADKEFNRKAQILKNKKKEYDKTAEVLKVALTSARSVFQEMQQCILTYKEAKEEELSDARANRDNIRVERNQAIEDLRNVESAFADLHRRYENTKTTVASMKENEEHEKKILANTEQKIKAIQEKYDTLKRNTQTSLVEANSEIENIYRSGESEISALKAMIKRSEMKEKSLEKSLEQKAAENEELSKLCDDLIVSVGTQ